MRHRTIDHRTVDRGEPGRQGIINTTEQLGPKQRLMPNGNLVCLGVPLARTGFMLYGPGEVPVPPGPSGVVYVERTEDALFEDQALNSFVGAAVTDDHPPEDVTPSNARKYMKGYVINAYRGTNDDADVVLGSLVITDADLIKSIRMGKREVSAGYDAHYTVDSPGHGRQSKIIVNHIALVTKGRCGPRCAIGDEAYDFATEEENTMPSATRTPLKTQRTPLVEDLRAKVRDAQAELEAAEQGVADEPGAVHVHIHNGPKADEDGGDSKTIDKTIDKRFVALEGSVTEIKDLIKGLGKTKDADPDVDDDEMDEDDEAATKDMDPAAKAAFMKMKKKKKTADAADDGEPGVGTKDSAALATSYTQLLAQAEVLVPGFRMPTFDASASRKATVDRMCQARTRALDAAYSTKDGAALIDGITGAKTLDLDSMDCKARALLFRAAATAKGLANNGAATQHSGKTADAASQQGIKQKPSIADANEAARKYWAAQIPNAQ